MTNRITRTATEQTRRNNKASNLKEAHNLRRTLRAAVWPVMDNGQSLVVVCFTGEYGEDGELYTGTDTYDRAGIIALAFEQARKYGETNLDCSKAENIINFVAECYDNGVIFCGTEAGLKQHQADRERTKLEAAASIFAHNCGHQVGTMGFVKALIAATNAARGQLNHYNSHESQAEEFMDHRAAGVDSETMWDNINYTRGQYSGRLTALEDIRTWLESECPLLMAQVAEQELATAE